ncbi:MAG: hypothetical protein ACI3ZZ_02215 [Candidatus Aphodosoma sp.]
MDYHRTAIITIPSCFVKYEKRGLIDYFYSANETIMLSVSSEEYSSLNSWYTLWSESHYGKSITYQTITDKFAVVSWWENSYDGYYCRADYINGKTYIWILQWNINIHKMVKSILDNREIKFIYR